MQEPQAWQPLGSKTVYRNRWLAVVLDEVALPDGRRYEYTRLEPPGIGVGVAGFNAAGELLLEREYRHGVGEVIWQLPGGLAGPGEDLQAAGLRELREETGYAPAQVGPETVRYLGVIWDNPAFGVACSHIYAAWGLAQVAEARRDPAELVTLHWQPASWLREAVRTGIIKDRVVVAAVAYLLLNGWME
ncbi:MAG TPA: NUDIX hydrolase [Caldilineaceae bacterium]|nr:NUDIX hydrolase [Caldilineaceae bacterium]